MKKLLMLIAFNGTLFTQALLRECPASAPDIPGMASLLHRIKKADGPTSRGLNYERAVIDLLIEQGHTVKVGDAAQAEGFDIVTETLCVECKNINMPPNPFLRGLTRRLLEQKRKAAAQKKQFVVYFKRRIVRRLKEWLEDTKISYVRYTC